MEEVIGMKNKETRPEIHRCDFCGKKKEVFRTHYGSGFKYVRLMCSDCEKRINETHKTVDGFTDNAVIRL